MLNINMINVNNTSINIITYVVQVYYSLSPLTRITSYAEHLTVIIATDCR